MNKHMIIYLVTNTVNGKQYVGITSRSLSRRWKQHLGDALRKGHPGIVLGKAIRKYGIKNFTVKQIATSLDWEGACETEKFLVKDLNTKSPNGYNLTDGGEGVPGVMVSEATRNKMRQHLKGVWADPVRRQRFLEGYGKREYSQEYRQRMAEWAKTFHIGRKQSFEEIEKRMLHLRGRKQRPDVVAAKAERQKAFYADPQRREELSARLTGIKRSVEFREDCRLRQLGKQHSATTKQRMSEARKGRKLSVETRARMSESGKGKIISLAAREKMAIAARKRQDTKRQAKFLALSSAALFKNYLNNFNPQQRSA